MRVEFIELLRCPQPHASSPLITVASRRDGEHLLEATLGCVVCGAEYALHDGVVYLTDAPSPSSLDSVAVAEVDPMRFAALLSLHDVTARALLAGSACAAAADIESLTGARCICLNPPRERPRGTVHTRLIETPGPSDAMMLVPGTTIPLATASLNGLAVDAAHTSLLHDARRVVRHGGRILAPVGAAVPTGCRELARDEREWVAEVESGSTVPVTLTRATGSRE